MATIYDIARQCNVTAATVSKALNNRSDISTKTKNRILEVAQQLGYTPNSSAKTLTTKRSYNIGILFDEGSNKGLSHEFFSKILEKIRYEVYKYGYDITFIANSSDENRTSFLNHCRYRQFDGVIAVCTDFRSKDFIELVNSDILVITIDYELDNISCVISDNSQGIKSLVTYLIQQGHSKIGYIHGQIEGAVTKCRLDAFKNILRSNHMEVRSEWIRCGAYYDLDTTYSLTKDLLSTKDRPTALLASDDYAALAIYKFAKDAKISIPGDLSVVGFDGIEISQILTPSLTTIVQNSPQIGTMAARQIMSLIENPSNYKKIVIDTKLQIGDSVKNIADAKKPIHD